MDRFTTVNEGSKGLKPGTRRGRAGVDELVEKEMALVLTAAERIKGP